MNACCARDLKLRIGNVTLTTGCQPHRWLNMVPSVQVPSKVENDLAILLRCQTDIFVVLFCSVILGIAIDRSHQRSAHRSYYSPPVAACRHL